MNGITNSDFREEKSFASLLPTTTYYLTVYTYIPKSPFYYLTKTKRLTNHSLSGGFFFGLKCTGRKRRHEFATDHLACCPNCGKPSTQKQLETIEKNR